MSKTCWDVWYLPILITSGRDFVVWKIQINAKKGRSNRSGAAILNDRTSIYSEGVIEMRNRATPCSCWCSSSIVNIRPVILSFTFWKNEKDEFETQEVLKLGSLLSGSADNPHIVSEGESANTAQGLFNNSGFRFTIFRSERLDRTKKFKIKTTLQLNWRATQFSWSRDPLVCFDWLRIAIGALLL